MVNAKSSVFLFIGDDEFSKNKAIEELVSSALGGSSRDLNYRAFDCAESDVPDILDYAGTLAFDGAKRVAVIRHFEQLPKESRKLFTEYLKNPPKTACIIIEADGSVDMDEGSPQGAVVRKFDAAGAPAAISRIKDVASQHGKKIDKAAIELLVELQGHDLMSMTSELDKLVSFVGDRTDIKAEDVEEVVGKNLEVPAFAITEAIAKKDADKALQIISDLTSSGRKPHETMGMLCWQIKRMARAKMMLEKGQTRQSVARALRIGSRYENDFFGQIATITLSQMAKNTDMLLEADLEIKRTKFDPSMILELAVVRLCLG